MEHKSIIHRKLASYYQQDRKKGRIKYNPKFECYTGYEMTLKEFKNILLKNGTNCYYCKEKTYLDNKVKFGSRQLTLDRICNFEAHSESNCIISCFRCNKERSNKYTVQEYQAIVNKTRLRPRAIKV